VIARIWHGVTLVADAEKYLAYLQHTGIADYRATDGNQGVSVLQRLEGDRVHFLLISLWESEDAIRKFAGDDITRAQYYPEDKGYLLELEPNVAHYQV
jgi:heme-degrading monooxygenase HmoA